MSFNEIYSKFGDNVHRIYPIEIGKTDTTGTTGSASNLDKGEIHDTIIPFPNCELSIFLKHFIIMCISRIYLSIDTIFQGVCFL